MTKTLIMSFLSLDNIAFMNITSSMNTYLKHNMLNIVLSRFEISENSVYFILYCENQCISKLDKIGIFTDMKFH